ncbi:hypothetical protein HK105_206434 [Polyrhizophydium stewartii]|uniref:non-specific serine/threonine protein kinase n=1 Tax=Polyrhizophydium stewartii TaxID=2732419 RepID=A0ABR4N3C9_9FUNG
MLSLADELQATAVRVQLLPLVRQLVRLRSMAAHVRALHASLDALAQALGVHDPFSAADADAVDRADVERLQATLALPEEALLPHTQRIDTLADIDRFLRTPGDSLPPAAGHLVHQMRVRLMQLQPLIAPALSRPLVPHARWAVINADAVISPRRRSAGSCVLGPLVHARMSVAAEASASSSTSPLPAQPFPSRIESLLDSPPASSLPPVAGVAKDSPVLLAPLRVHDINAAVAALAAAADTLTAMRHPCIATPLRMCLNSDMPFVVFDAACADLATVLAHQPCVGIHDRARWIADVASAMRFLHAHTPPMLLGALSPRGVLVASDGTARVIPVALAPDGRIACALAAHAPHYTLGDSAADIFAFGMLCIRVLDHEPAAAAVAASVRLPTDPVSAASTPGASPVSASPHLDALAYGPQSVPGDLWQLVHDCVHPDPSRRPPFTAIVAALERMPISDVAQASRPLKRRLVDAIVDDQLAPVQSNPDESSPHQERRRQIVKLMEQHDKQRTQQQQQQLPQRQEEEDNKQWTQQQQQHEQQEPPQQQQQPQSRRAQHLHSWHHRDSVKQHPFELCRLLPMPHLVSPPQASQMLQSQTGALPRDQQEQDKHAEWQAMREMPSGSMPAAKKPKQPTPSRWNRVPDRRAVRTPLRPERTADAHTSQLRATQFFEPQTSVVSSMLTPNEPAVVNEERLAEAAQMLRREFGEDFVVRDVDIVLRAFPEFMQRIGASGDNWTRVFRELNIDKRDLDVLHPSISANDSARPICMLPLASRELKCPIPPLMFALPNLVELNLSFNSLTGPIPHEIGLAQRLRRVSLVRNKLTGSIPASIGELRGLMSLLLGHNQLSGALPLQLFELRMLEHLGLYQNHLTGPLPEEIGNLVRLRTLKMYQNHLEGSIPSTLANLRSLTFLALSANHLTGPIPPELGQLVNLRVLRLSQNKLAGSIPRELGNLVMLTDLRLECNRLTGPIPVELAALTDLKDLLLHRNHLEMPPPAELADLLTRTSCELYQRPIGEARERFYSPQQRVSRGGESAGESAGA